MNNDKIEPALQTIHEALMDINGNDLHAEDFYWWEAVLLTFGYEIDEENGRLVKRNADH